MHDDDLDYHRERERQCREMAAVASDDDIRRRHEEMADFHARHLYRPDLQTPANDTDALHAI